ncbi:zinc finger protein-like 1 [Melopsittacus undulatus]|uniref:zinc finger protein-like 1 n=1 Tax=Melopsittacus undulatus TaxID=13146 RepID=UPI00146F2DED|nr:zinc finger protein-like 1 [Melopsittacus undulatus]
MGLCKCPKRRVTNLFCFEHRVNVCESCLVSAHPKCIVQSYLQWLQDSDYSPDCALCGTALQGRDTVRLVCYDVFHWSCLSARARALPARTAPAGHLCPTCGGPLIPPPNLEGPLAAALRKRLAAAHWARPGLGLPLIDDLEEPPEPDPNGESFRDHVTPPEPPPSPPSPPPHAVVHMAAESIALHAGSGPRKVLGGARGSCPPPDREEDKYRRRPVLAWLPHRLRCRLRGPPRPPLLLLLLGAGLALLLLGAGLSRGVGGGGGDPALEPLNPRVPLGH